MNDKDKKEFEKWFKTSYLNDDLDWVAESAWQAACDYKQAEIDELKTQDQIIAKEIRTYMIIAENLKAENVKLREVIGFYADEKSWNKRSISPGYSYSPQYMCIGINDDAYLHEVSKDGDGYSGEWYENSGYVGGKRARQVLKELDEEL